MLIENAGSYSLVRSEDEIAGDVASASRSQNRCPLTPGFSATELLISRKFAAVSAPQGNSVPLMSGFVDMFVSDHSPMQYRLLLSLEDSAIGQCPLQFLHAVVADLRVVERQLFEVG